MGRLPYKVTEDPAVTPLRELAYLPEGVMNPHEVPHTTRRAGLRPEEILQQMEQNPPEQKAEKAKA